MPRMVRVGIGMVLLAAAGCTQGAPDGQQAAGGVAIEDRDWALVELGEWQSPVGAEGQPLTLRLDSETERAVGFGGCNQYGGEYTLAADSLTFGPVIATRMYCEGFNELEQSYFSMLERVTAWQASDSVLTLASADGPLARFHAR